MEADYLNWSLGNVGQYMMINLYQETVETGNVFEKLEILVVKRIEFPKEKENEA